MHLIISATPTWLITASLIVTIGLGSAVAGESPTQPQPAPTPSTVAAKATPARVMVSASGVDEKKFSEKLKQTITYDFFRSGSRDLLDYLRSITDLNIIVHPSVDTANISVDTAELSGGWVSFHGKDTTIRETLGKLAWLLDARCVLIDQAVFITRLSEDDFGLFEEPGKDFSLALAAADKTEWGKAMLALLDQESTFEFQNTDVIEALALLQQATGLPLVLDTRVGAEARLHVTLRVEVMDFRCLLNHLMRLSNLRYRLENEAILITVAEPMEPERGAHHQPHPPQGPHIVEGDAVVTLKALNMRSIDAARWLESSIGVTIRIDPQLAGDRLSFNLQNIPAADAVDGIARSMHAEVKPLPGNPSGYLIVPISSPDDKPASPGAAE